MDPALRQVRLRRYGRARPSARIDLSASSMAERILLRCGALDRQVRLHLSKRAHFREKGVDPRGDVLSAVQLDLLVVRSWQLLRLIRESKFCPPPSCCRLSTRSNT